MNGIEVLADGFGRLPDLVHRVLDGLSADQLEHRPAGTGNSIGWLVWHLARVQDAQVAAPAGVEQVWIAKGWVGRLGLALAAADTGYGHDSEKVAAVRGVSAQLLGGYFDEVHEQTHRYLHGLRDGDLDRVVDTSYDPPVVLGTRLVSVLADDLEHVGQAAYLKGLAAAR